MWDLYIENYKTLKTVKEDVNKSRDIPHSWVGILNIVEMPVPGSSLTIQSQSNMNGPRLAKAVLRKKNKFGVRTRPPDLLLRNLYTGQEATIRTGRGTTDWFQIGKGVHQGCILSPCLFNFYAEYIMRNAGLEEAQAGIKIAGRNQ